MINERMIEIRARDIDAQVKAPIEYDPNNALTEPSPEMIAACAAVHAAKTARERRRAQKELKAQTRPGTTSEADKVALVIGMTKCTRDPTTCIVMLTVAAQRARRAGALRASLHALREAQAIHFDADRERLMDEITSDLVTGRYHATPPTDATSAPKESDPGHGARSTSSSPGTPRTPGRKNINGRKKKNVSGAAAKRKNKTPAPPSSPRPPDDRPLVIAGAFDRVSLDDLRRVPTESPAAYLTVLSSASSGFIGTIEIARSNRGDRSWRCPRCRSCVDELHVTAPGRVECAACRDHVGVNWRSFGPEVTALIERMTRGERIPAAVIVDAVARHMEASS